MKASTVFGRKLLVGLCLASIASLCWAHENDPKARDRQPRYEGAGYRMGQDAMRGSPAFASDGVTLLSWLPLPEFGNHSSGNDCWGYVSPSGREYALMGLEKGTGFVEITDPTDAQIIAVMTGPTSLWRDIKTYQSYAYAVSEGGGGIQVFDLSQIDDGIVTELPSVNTPAGTTGKTHNVAIDEVSGFLYRCGGDSNGLRIYSLANPAAPVYSVSWSDRYVHDVQVVTYTSGPYAGKQIAFACAGFNGGSVSPGLDIIDVTNKAAVDDPGDGELLANNYNYDALAAYSHQAWLSPDRQTLYLDDELEGNNGVTSTIHVIDVSDLSNPQQVNTATNGNTAISHNLYTRGDYIFCSNYRSGLRVYDASLDPEAPVQTAYFDTYPADDGTSFNGLWSNYPFFPSGLVIGSDLERGLFVWWLGPQPLNFSYPQGLPQNTGPDGMTVRVDVGEVGEFELDASSVTLYYDDGDGFEAAPMSEVTRGSGSFEVTLPTLNCPGAVQYYVGARTVGGFEWHDPQGAPSMTHSSEVAIDQTNLMADDFQTDLGWTPSIQGATSGQWQRGVPVNDGGWQYDPASDSDGSGQCYLTQNETGNTDVDNGAVVLVSPLIDGSAGNLIISYDYYLYLTDSSGVDKLLVEVSDNDTAGPWVTVASHTQNNATSWSSVQISQNDLDALGVAATSTMRLRFTANDDDPASIVEAGVDAISIDSAVCEVEVPSCSEDIAPAPNGDGQVSIADVTAVITAFGLPCKDCPQDVAPAPNGDGQVTIADVTAVLTAFGPCDP